MNLCSVVKISRSYGAMLLTVASAISLAIFPAPICFDCEYPNAWGMADAAVDRNFLILASWILMAPCLAALCKLKQAWIVPVGLGIAEVFTQHLGGVPWSFIKQEDAFFGLILTLPLGFASLFVGWLVSLAFNWTSRVEAALE